MSRLYFLTAEIGAGKTTFCHALVDEARAAGWDAAGILCPPVFESGVKTGILAQNLRTEESRLLAVASHLSLPTFHLPLGNWIFDPSIIAWGNEILAAALPCNLFIVDELGPLELIRGEGWLNALEALRQPTTLYKIGVAVVRPSLLASAQKLFPQAQTLTLPQDARAFFLSLQGV